VRRPLRTLLVLVAAAVILVVGALAFYLVVLRDDPPDRLTLSPESEAPDPSGGRESPEGQWVVRAGDDTVVGYRVRENLAGIDQEAAGRTHDVQGTLTVEGDSTITAADVTAGLQSLESDEDRRDNAIRSRGLETDRFPEATFRLTQPVELPSAPERDQDLSATVTGDLTLHGVTKSVEVPIQARWDGGTIEVVGSLPIMMADYDIDPPNVGGFVSVQDRGELELQLTFVPA
jgi:polyisoprenoid-binding protein YceI